MARAAANKLYRNFVKGLITEASPLTYPEDASTDEDNFVLFRKGNRARRFGIDYETDYSFGAHTLTNTHSAITSYTWDSVANDPDLDFFVNQVGTTLYFYRLEGGETVSTGLKSFTVDLTSYVKPDVIDPHTYEVSMASGKGLLFVVGDHIEPLHVSYDVNADAIETSQIYIQIRDFKGVDDGLANDEEPTTLSVEHEYNLMNQGWIDGAVGGATLSRLTYPFHGGVPFMFNKTAPAQTYIEAYYTQHTKYPSNSQQWWVAKKTTEPVGTFDPALLSKFYTGNTRAPRGHFIVNAFDIDRDSASGLTGLDSETTSARPSSVAFFGGRIWYGVGSTVYFSQVLDDKRQVGMCYQEADPTSEDINDLVATDGGVIPIPEMGKVIKLLPAGIGMLVFADNGIWYISGTTAGFTAIDFSVAKINPIGAVGAGSIIDANGQIVWWSKVGIQGLSPKTGLFGPVEGGFDRVNISEQTIHSFYMDEIPEEAKKHAKALYDPATNTIQWLFRSGDTPGTYFYDRILSLDMTLGAFYPWSISSATDRPYITGFLNTPNLNTTAQSRSSFIKYLTAVPVGAAWQFTFSLFHDTTFADWRTFEGSTGYAYTSYLETGYELLDDAMRSKATRYVFVYLRRTEESYVASGDDYTTDKQSSCRFSIRWDWANSSISNKWSTEIEAYRHTRLPMFSTDNLEFDTGYPIVVTKNKVRGNGRAIQFRFECGDIGKDCDLHGWAVAFTGNSEP